LTERVQTDLALTRWSAARLAARWSVFMRDVLLPVVASRILLASVGVLSIAALPHSPWVPFAWLRSAGNPLVDAFARWDALHYVAIAANGYPATVPANAAFFPLYPLLVRSVALAGGGVGTLAFETSALIVSNLALIAAAAGLIALVRLDHDRATASRAVWYLVAFPTSLFLSAAYAESLFLALSIGAVLAGRRQRWMLAGVLGGLAALTRPFGFLVALPLAIEAYLQWRAGSRSWRPIAGILTICGALAGWIAFLTVHFHDPLAFLHAEKNWGRHLSPPWQAFINFFNGPLTANSGSHSIIDFVFAVVTIALVIIAWKVLRPSYALYLTALVLVPLSSGSLGSLSRFDVTFFPIIVVLAVAGRWRAFDRAYLVAAMGLGAVFMALYAQWYWVA
jgi:hypothetical protein